MQVQSVSLYNFSYNKPSFEGGNGPVKLGYVLSKHSKLLPDRVREEAIRLVRSGTGDLPTLREVHQRAYAQLRECATLEDAKRIYPEFAQVLDAGQAFGKIRGNIKTLSQKGQLNEDLSLKLLKDFWGELKTHEEISKELGLTNRNSVGYILDRIGIPAFRPNYKTLILSSEPETHAIISAKTTAWNTAHPDLMRAHNKMAAQGNKAPSKREASSVRMKEYDINHPERIQKISDFWKEVWGKVPEVKEKLREFISNQDTSIRKIIAKDANGEHLTAVEERMKTIMYKKFWESNPEYLEQYRQAIRETSHLRK